LVEGIFRRAHSRLLVASQPIDDVNTLSEVIVFAPRASALRGGRLADWVICESAGDSPSLHAKTTSIGCATFAIGGGLDRARPGFDRLFPLGRHAAAQRIRKRRRNREHWHTWGKPSWRANCPLKPGVETAGV